MSLPTFSFLLFFCGNPETSVNLGSWWKQNTSGCCKHCQVVYSVLQSRSLVKHSICSKIFMITQSLYTGMGYDVSVVTLTHWGRVTHICVSKLTIIGSDNGLSPGRRQTIIWTNAGILLIGPLGINFSEILIEILTFSFKKMHLKMSSGKWRPSCLCLNVLTHKQLETHGVYSAL